MAKFMVAYTIAHEQMFESEELVNNLREDLAAIIMEKSGRQVTATAIISHFFAEDNSIPSSDQFETYILNSLSESEDEDGNFKYTPNDLNQISMAIVRMDRSDTECLLHPFS